jgi:hypothetical protein
VLARSASVGLGTLMILWPGAGGFGIVVLLGSFALLFGTLMLTLALKLRRLVPCRDIVQDGFGPRPNGAEAACTRPATWGSTSSQFHRRH